jgi:hypothetical protein
MSAGGSSESEAFWRQHLGRKVSIRYRMHGDPRHPFSEAVGVVQAVFSGDDGVVRVSIMNRRGEEVTMPLGDILAVKVFPPT